MKKLLILFFAWCLSWLVFTSCEKVNLAEDEKEEIVDGVNLTFQVTQFDQLIFGKHKSKTRIAIPLKDVCSRINLAIFQAGKKIKSINQTSGSEEFGRISMSLAKGRYQVVIIAHNGEKSATISSPTEIKFHNNKVTDTFYHYEDITLENNMIKDIILQRAVAKFILATEDAIPENVVQMEFKYTGGSSTFNAISGTGSIHSRQTEIKRIDAEMTGKPATFEIYTFPRIDSKGLNITVTAQDQAGTIVAEKSFTDVAVQMNTITQYSGMFFDEFIDAQAREFQLKVDTAWVKKNDVRF